MIELALKNISKYFGGNEVLTDITFEILVGDKVGIVGRNGTGKTTLFKIINGLEGYDGGTLSIRKDCTIGYLDQIPLYPMNYTVLDVLNTAFQEEYQLLEQLKGLEDKMAQLTGPDLDKIIKHYGEVQQLFTLKGGYAIEEKLCRICTGLKITEGFKSRNFNDLSGGEKTTVLLGKILLQSCNLLLLDEPSNHLDLESIEWLEGYLREYSGTVLIISHDRYFLDRIINKVIELEDGKSQCYLGNYSQYEKEKNIKLLVALEDYKNQQKKIKAMENTIKTLKDWGIRGDNSKFHKKAASIQKRLDKIEKLKRPILERRKIQVDFTTNLQSGKDVIQIISLGKAFHNTLLFKDLNVLIRNRDKVAILGKNGCGKTTLIKIITGLLHPDSGTVKVGASVRIGYLEQNIVFENEELSVLDTLRSTYPCSEETARRILAKFLFFHGDVFKKLAALSGGEKSRLRLCQLMHQNVNTLILDEPTNHLDIESREMLEDALEDFEGTVIFISHDRYFINQAAEKILVLQDGQLIEYHGNYDRYREQLLECQDENLKIDLKPIKNSPLKERVKKNSHNQFQLANIENQIQELEIELNQIDEEIIIYSTDYQVLQELSQQRNGLQQQLNDLMEKWLLLSTD